MELEQILLKKEELPILYENGFVVPIHPIFLDESISLNPNIAKDIYPDVQKDWLKDLREYIEKEKIDGDRKIWYEEVFFNGSPPSSRPQVDTSENGFAKYLSIGRNIGGTVYFNKEDDNCNDYISENNGIYISKWEGRYIKFSEEKTREFSLLQEDGSRNQIVYALHNVDFYHGALLLRNWAIAYENEALKSIFSQTGNL